MERMPKFTRCAVHGEITLRCDRGCTWIDEAAEGTERMPKIKPPDRKVRILAVSEDGKRRYYLGRKGEGLARVYTWHRDSKAGPGVPTLEIAWTPKDAEQWLTIGRFLTLSEPEGCKLRIEDAPEGQP